MDSKDFYSREEVTQINTQFYADRTFRSRVLVLRSALMLGNINADKAVATVKELLDESLQKQKNSEGMLLIGIAPESYGEMMKIVKEETLSSGIPSVIAEGVPAAEKEVGEEDLPEKARTFLKNFALFASKGSVGISEIRLEGKMGEEKMNTKLCLKGFMESMPLVFTENWEITREEFNTLSTYYPKLFGQFKWIKLQYGKQPN